MKNFVLFNFAILFVVHTLAFSRETPKASAVIEKSVNYLSHQQYLENKDLYTAGEWPAEMKSYFLPALLGVGKLFAKPTAEPTSFATSSIINLISEIYLIKPELIKIPAMINLGLTSLPLYKDSDVYSYYQWSEFRGVKVRAPLAEGYVPGFIRGLTNIPSDADTTSATYMALAFSKLISSEIKLSDFKIPQGALDTFNTHRDINRKPHYYNRLDSINNSGAFLTWFQFDHEPNMPRGVFAKPDKGTRIPFGFNDVDCVVNANVMRVLTATNNTDHPGYNDSCKLLNFVIIKNKQSQCGIYYPNSYAVMFSISNVYKLGAQCLEESRSKAISFLVSTQKDDGSWDNEPGIGRTDTIQSTALALIALMNYTEKGSLQYTSAVRAGAFYLLNNLRTNGDSEIYWKGEVFFAAVAQARNTVLWRSNTYTTAMVTLALAKAQDFLGGEL